MFNQQDTESAESSILLQQWKWHQMRPFDTVQHGAVQCGAVPISSETVFTVCEMTALVVRTPAGEGQGRIGREREGKEGEKG